MHPFYYDITFYDFQIRYTVFMLYFLFYVWNEESMIHTSTIWRKNEEWQAHSFQPNSIHYQYTLADQIFCYPCHETFSINGQGDTEMFLF